LAEMLGHVGNAGQSLLGAIAGISGGLGGKRSVEEERLIALAGQVITHVQNGNIQGAIQVIFNHPTVQGLIGGIFSGKRSAEEQRIIEALTGALSGHVSEILTHGQVILANLANTFLQNLLGNLSTLPGKRQLGGLNFDLNTLIALAASLGIDVNSLIASLGVGKRSAEDVRIIATITNTLSNLWAGLHPVVMPHVDNLLAEMLGHVGNAGQSLLGAIAGISGGIVGGKRSAEEQRIIATITNTLSNLWAGLHPTIMPHVDNLLAEMLGHVGNAGQSLLGAIAGISGGIVGGY